MKIKILVLGLLILLSFAYCKSPASPDIEEILEPQDDSPSLSALVIMEGKPLLFTDRYNKEGQPIFGYSGYDEEHGMVKNIGDITAYNVEITTILYDSSNKELIRTTVNPYYYDSVLRECFPKKDLAPDESAKWMVIWLKSNLFYNEFDDTKTKFEINWQ